jgi:hypothetical protein
MSIDALLGEVVSRIASDVARLLRPVIRTEVTAALAEHDQGLEPLGKILDCSQGAARSRMNRDRELAALAMRVGNRWLFRRSDVLSLYSRRNSSPKGKGRMSIVGGGDDVRSAQTSTSVRRDA